LNPTLQERSDLVGGAGCAHLEKSWNSSVGMMTSHI